MRILITGNMGYIGPVVVSRLRESYPHSTLAGLDTGYFAHCLTGADALPECAVDVQYFADIREVPPAALTDVDAIVHLAAISNDPMGNSFEKATLSINHRASVELARQAKRHGVATFVFASSCSIYGLADDAPRNEGSPLNPLTAYARSKVATERELRELADRSFKVTCLRFATACGMSPRLRLDLVVNDFVACAVTSRLITILSDGTPWRPLIHVRDMARCIDWAIQRDRHDGGDFLAVNAGSSRWNFQVSHLAQVVASAVPDVQVEINRNAAPDNRSYRVDFGLFERLAPAFQPQVELAAAVLELKAGLEAMRFSDTDFRASQLMRLEVLRQLSRCQLIDADLRWTSRAARHDAPMGGAV